MTSPVALRLFVSVAIDQHEYFKFGFTSFVLLVYVIGLHAVQLGNNRMKKIPSIAKIEDFFVIQLFPNWTSM